MPGRKSAAALSVVVGSIDGRPSAPADLTKDQCLVWDRTVANEGADTFKTAALQQLLREYCRHVVSARKLAGMIEAMEAVNVNDLDLDDYDKLLRMRDRETKALADKATKLRLTNQSRYTPQAAATAAKRGAGTDMKPWQVAS